MTGTPQEVYLTRTTDPHVSQYEGLYVRATSESCFFSLWTGPSVTALTEHTYECTGVTYVPLCMCQLALR